MPLSRGGPALSQAVKPDRAAYTAAIMAGIVCAGLASVAIWGAVNPIEHISRQAEGLVVKQNPQAGVLAQRALRANPMDATAVQVAGIAADHAGQSVKALELLSLSNQVSRRDIVTQSWLLQHDLKVANYPSAMAHIDAILRTYPDTSKAVFPVLASIASDPRADVPIANQLSTLPPWRAGFLALLADKSDPAVSFNILSQLNAGPTKLTDAEITGYLNKLMSLKQYDKAFLGWLLFMPQGRLASFKGLYDGDFDSLPGPQPFNWVLAGGVGGTVNVRPSASRPRDQALQITYDGFSSPTLAYQWMVLPPGPQRLSMDALYETPEVRDRLIWQVTCAESGVALLQMKMPAGGSWKRYSQDFTVPDTGCGAQQLILLPKPGDHLTSMSAWFDKIAIEPASVEAPR
jgi:hypothetical protein